MEKKRESEGKPLLKIFILCVLVWSFLGFIVYFLPPSLTLLILGHMLLFLGTTLASLLLLNYRRALLIGITITLFFLMRYLHISHPLNVLMLLTIAITLEIFFTRE